MDLIAACLSAVLPIQSTELNGQSKSYPLPYHFLVMLLCSESHAYCCQPAPSAALQLSSGLLTTIAPDERHQARAQAQRNPNSTKLHILSRHIPSRHNPPNPPVPPIRQHDTICHVPSQYAVRGPSAIHHGHGHGHGHVLSTPSSKANW